MQPRSRVRSAVAAAAAAAAIITVPADAHRSTPVPGRAIGRRRGTVGEGSARPAPDLIGLFRTMC